MKWKVWVLAAGLLIVSGCLKTRSEISETDDREKMQQITPQEQQRADQEVRVQDAEASLRQVVGRIEALEQRLNSDMETRNKENSQSQETNKRILEQLKVSDENFQRIETRLRSIEEAKKSQVTAPAVAPKDSKDGTKDLAYAEAEGLMQKKDYKKAILSYQKYREQEPKGKHVSDATYKIGVCFQELGKKDEAKVFYDEVVEKYPQSSSARKAQFRLKGLK